MRLLPSAALLAVAIATSASPAAHGGETRQYVAASGDMIVLLCSERPSVGGACFNVPAAHPTARIRITDATALPVGGAYRFEAADGTSLSRGSFCESINAAIPAAAKTLTVFVDSVRSPLDCPPVNGVAPGVGTTGEVTVTWLGTTPPGGGGGGPPVLGTGAGAIVGSGTFGGRCMTFAGAISYDTGRARWLFEYWPSHPGPSTAGVCTEEIPHHIMTLKCVETMGPELFAHATGDDRREYLVRVWDGGADETDQVGVMVGVPGADRCGAADVPLSAVTDGSYLVLDAP